MSITDIIGGIFSVLYVAVALIVIGKYEKRFKTDGKISRHEEVTLVMFGALWIISLPVNYIWNKCFR